MKKLIVLALSTGLLVLLLGIGANSADAACSTKCLTKKINKLQRQVGASMRRSRAQHGSRHSTRTSCIQRVSVTQYFGYNYTTPSGSFSTTALDFTEPGSPIEAWLLAIPPGTCGTATSRTAVPATRRVLSKPWQPVGPPQTKH
jgi:hypothetical protein